MDKVTCIDKCPQPRAHVRLQLCAYILQNPK